MSDAQAAPAVFEPEETAVLEAALSRCTQQLSKRCDEEQVEDIARIIHDVAAERLRFKKPVVGSNSVDAIATEALEQLSFLREAPAELIESALTHKDRARSAALPGHFFPLEFRKRPEQPLQGN